MEKVLATISDVARLSGMSVSTVSRVINNKPHVSEEKRQKILEAMDALGYSPLQAARQLRGSGSGI
ncbi:LacI family DNA-binding transcriptional regulator [[Ruminococcus] torques]|nr:LacI family DNA-binding transcriptional regulator [[Ruminococcus] torques]